MKIELLSPSVERQNRESPAALDAHRPEVPLIKCEHVGNRMPAGQHNDRRISQTDLQVGILLDDLFRLRNVVRTERLQLVGAAHDLIQQSQLRAVTDVAHEQIVELGEYERGEQ